MLTAVGWGLLGLAGAGAVVVGVHRHRPARKGPWLLLAAAILALATGDVCYEIGTAAAADAAYLAMFPLIGLFLALLTRGAAVLVDRAHLIDLLALSTAALLVTWVFLIGPPGGSGATAANLLGGCVLLGAVGWLIVASRGNPSAILLGVGAAGMLASDVVHPIAPGHLSELGYVTLYVCWGAAALHPSMARLTAPAPARSAPLAGRWAVLLGLSVATPPTVLLLEAVSGGVTDGIAIATAAGITLVLTIIRLTDSLDQHSQALVRERGLREASAAMVAAADVAAVDEAVRAGVRHLLPRGALRQLIFAADDREVAASALPPLGAGGHRRSWWRPGSPDASADAEATLVCALWVEPAAVARPHGGALVVVGRHEALAAIRDAVEVLASQAALALDRIALVEAVGRRDSDLFLRAVVGNTTDVMIVTDDDERVRYASPALRKLLGSKPAPLSHLSELAHPDDRHRLRAALLGNGDGSLFCALQRADGSQVLVEVIYRDLRADRLVRGLVVTVRDVTDRRSVVPSPRAEDLDHLPGAVNRRSARGKFRY